MATEQDRRSFFAEFETLKAKYGSDFADLQLVRFAQSSGPVVRDFSGTYSCTMDGEGYITCEDDRPV